MRRIAALAAALVALASPARAQTRVTAEQVVPAADGTARVVVRVTDANGSPLQPDTAGVTVRVGSAAMPVRGVTRAAELPRAVVFIVCHSRAQPAADVAATASAFTAMADRLDRPGDRAALVACGDHAEIVSGWAPPADVRRAIDGVRATTDEVDEAEALRLAAAIPPNGLRRLAVVRTDGRHIDPATESDVAKSGLPVFPLAVPGTTDVLPLVNLARATGGSYLDGSPGDALAALLRRLDAAWLVAVAVPPGATGALSVRVGGASSRLASVALARRADSTAAPVPPSTAVADSATESPRREGLPLGWIALAALAIAAGAGWVLLRKPAISGAAPEAIAAEDERLPAETPPVSPLHHSPAPVVSSEPGSSASPYASDTDRAVQVRLVGDGIDVVLVLDRPRWIGRDAAADVVLSDPSVSARHAELRVEGGQVVVRDLGSTNGLVVEGERARHAPVHDGTRLVLGQTALSVRLAVAPTS